MESGSRDSLSTGAPRSAQDRFPPMAMSTCGEPRWSQFRRLPWSPNTLRPSPHGSRQPSSQIPNVPRPSLRALGMASPERIEPQEHREAASLVLGLGKETVSDKGNVSKGTDSSPNVGLPAPGWLLAGSSRF